VFSFPLVSVGLSTNEAVFNLQARQMQTKKVQLDFVKKIVNYGRIIKVFFA